MWLKIVDFGLVILIWVTQLSTYPSFLYYAEEDLVKWHEQYTTAITIIVMPLMIAQVGLHIVGMLNDFNWLRLIIFLMIVAVWLNTFLVAVPLHNMIASGSDVMNAASKLVRINWMRTILWTLVFLIGIIGFSRNPHPVY